MNYVTEELARRKVNLIGLGLDVGTFMRMGTPRHQILPLGFGLL